ncbi:uncharacterized protein BDW70DRAFT_130155 [Aspergillus foveolatus]|uniref:uncharacterized protein n=1 Tax=Aspergillus foveolatus TaxID=210207 RepID=UPI003CCD4479
MLLQMAKSVRNIHGYRTFALLDTDLLRLLTYFWALRGIILGYTFNQQKSHGMRSNLVYMLWNVFILLRSALLGQRETQRLC